MSDIKLEVKPEPEYMRKLFLGGLNYATTEETIRNYFEKWGEIVDCVVMRNPNTKVSRGFGFVTFGSSESVDECQRNRPHKIDNRSIQPKRAVPRDLISEPNSEASVRKVFISGLKDDVTDDDLRNHFEQYGTITDILVVLDKETKKSRGFGFVEFDDYDPVDKIIMEKHHEIMGKRVNIKKAISKDQMANKRGSAPSGNYWNPGPVNSNYNSNYNAGGGGYGAGYGGGDMSTPNNSNWNQAWNNGSYSSSIGDGPGPIRGGSGLSNYRSNPYSRNAPANKGSFGSGDRY